MKRYLRAIALIWIASSATETIAENNVESASSLRTGQRNDNDEAGMMGVRRKTQKDKKVAQMKAMDGMMDNGKVPPPPTDKSSSQPFATPSAAPSTVPSAVPTEVPSNAPSDQPSLAPSPSPSSTPTTVPSSIPSEFPSSSPSDVPTSGPSNAPSSAPVAKSADKGKMNGGGMNNKNKGTGLKGDGVMGSKL